MANSRIMKNYKSTRETWRKAQEYYFSKVKASNLAFDIEHKLEEGTEAMDDAKKELAKIKGSSSMTEEYKECFEAITNASEYDALVFALSGDNANRIFSALSDTEERTTKSGDKKIVTVRKRATTVIGCTKFDSIISDLAIINGQLLTFNREATENGIEFTTRDGKLKWKLYRDKVAELLQMLSHGDGVYFYGCEMPSVKKVAVDIFRTAEYDDAGDVKKTNDRKFIDTVLKVFVKILKDCDFVDNFKPEQAETPEPEQTEAPTPEKPVKRTSKKSAPEKTKAPETK